MKRNVIKTEKSSGKSGKNGKKDERDAPMGKISGIPSRDFLSCFLFLFFFWGGGRKVGSRTATEDTV